MDSHFEGCLFSSCCVRLLVRALHPLHGSGRRTFLSNGAGRSDSRGGWQATLTMPSAGSGKGNCCFRRVNSDQWRSIGVPTSPIAWSAYGRYRPKQE
jgi:hypothetical protein